MIAIDLFSGCGGLTQGLKMAGFTVVAAVENDDLAVETYSYNHPEVTLYANSIEFLSSRVIMSQLKLKPGDLDLLAGCPPCQGFSYMRTKNRKKAVRDVRNNLIFSYIRFVSDFMPKTIMMENVPGLLFDKRFRHAIRSLYKLGYNCRFRVLDVSEYGVPQRRRRLIMIGSRFSTVDFATASLVKRTVRHAIARMPVPGESGDTLHDYPEVRTPSILRKIELIPRNGGGRIDLPEGEQLGCHQRTEGFKDVYGRMWWNRVAPTITGGCVSPSKGRFLHPHQHRAITLREAALLQTFPRNYVISLRRGKGGAALMIGNALPPEFIRRHALKLRHHIEKL